MVDENTDAILRELRNIQAELGACVICLVILTFLAAGAAYNVFGGPFWPR